MIQICISRQLQTESANAALVDDTGCGKVAAAEKRGVQRRGGRGERAEKTSAHGPMRVALRHTLVQVFCPKDYLPV